MAEHIIIPGSLTVDFSGGINQQGIYNAIRTAYPTSPDYTVVSIAVPLININCIDIGVIDPVAMLKDAANKIYNYAMQYYIQPIWNALYSLYEALKGFGLGVLDLSIGILDLTLADLFDPNLINKLKIKILALYDSVTGAISDTLKDLLNLLGIPWPISINSKAPQFDIEYIINSILSSLWGFIIKLIKEVWGLIATGLRLWEIATQRGAIIWSQIWADLKDSFIGGTILDLLTRIPTIQDIWDALVAFAKQVYDKAVVTYEEILAVLKDFTFFGLRPFDWDLPWNPSVNFPEFDLMRMLNSMLQWIKNWMFNIINQFVRAIANILNAFGISLSELLSFSIPLSFCAVKNE